ncbi:Ig-like domain-containing protein [Daejeonella rubra]|uniref:Ig-like domain-containing protein n=1 Tax=Daejeonella rubra TaxID=990371 RepID=A0A1G9RNU3_9SPHI|nr:Ig-like domain-containing domain [Daejeonella rubra]SDM24740.1 Ig-like domain-containing protein [Daejeonella rubra]
MANIKRTIFLTVPGLVFFYSLFLISCASVQSPTGGPRDTIQPVIVKELPKNLTRNFTASKIEIEFDEFVKLSNEFTEISVSPAMDIPPTYKARKEILQISFEEELQKNTTYTINFGKAIADVNEGNILKNYSYVFSTGNEIDSLSISGKVISSLTKQNLKDVTVFILPISQDSLFGKKKASFFTTTDTSGSFKLSNLRADKYRIYALNEQGGDRIYNGNSEEIGFLNEPINLNKDTSNIELQVFKEVPKIFSVLDRKIESDGRVTLTFNKPIQDPSVNILEPSALNTSKTVEFSNIRDSAIIWLPELTFDSLKVAVNSKEKSLDTVILRRNKRDTYTPLLNITDNIIGTKIRPGSELAIKFSSPIKSYDDKLISILEDSIAIRGFEIVKNERNPRTYNIKYPWKLKKQYILRLENNAFTDILENKTKAYARKFELDSEDNYGSISIKITVPDTSKNYIIQWLGDNDKALRQDRISKNSLLNYTRYPTAKYRIRVIYDANNNGEWDTGNVILKKQPEDTWTFDKTISLRPNWDLEENVIIPNPE